MTKRILSIFTTLIMAVSFAGVFPAITAGALTYGDYIYEILYDGTVDITDYKGSATTLAIPSTIDGKIVTRIRGHAFEYHVSLTNVTIPDSITSIGSFAFHHCTNLTNVVIPSSVTGIGECAFWGCSSLSEITVPNSVEEIGPQAFCGCISLKAVTIPGSVTAIESDVFSNCDELTEVTISDDVQSIGNRAFEYCTSLKEVTIPSSVRSIGDETFRGCSSLSMVTIPGLIGYHAFYDCTALNSVVISKGGEIGQGAFGGCSGLNTLIISDVTKIKWNAFYGCTSLTDVYYSGSKEQWDKIDIYSGNDCLTNSIIHYDSIGETDLPNSPSKQLYFVEPIAILDVGEARQLVVHSRDVSNVNGELVYSNDQVMDNNELVWNSTNYKDNSIIELSDTGEVTAISNGIEYVSVHSKDDISLGTSCHIFVGKPNEFSYTATYDTKQYYAEGGFFSEKSSVSDCVEIYMLLENKLADELKDLTGIEDELNSDDAKTRFKVIDPITLTATVNGNDLSFSRDAYTNTYSTTFDALSVEKAVDDVLMLFPTDDINIASSGNTYTVKVTLESESFDTVTEEYNFTIENFKTKSANEHITFTTSNDYKKSKENIYGEAMATMKNDAEYWVSKFYSFDFENYCEVVFADVLVELMDVNQMRHISLLPVIKEWVGNYNTILSSVSKIVEEDGSSGIKVPDNAVDKLLKKSKYVTDGMEVDDELRDLVVMKLHEKVSIDKINSVFAVVDKTQQFYSFFKLGVNITNDIADYINSVSILNTYKEMNDDFKTVIKQLYDNIPDSESKLKSAVNHYVNLNTDLGQSEEYFSEVISLSKNITLDVFKTVYKAQFSAALVKSIGSISIKGGVALSSTAAFSSISTGLSAGTTLGLCISDFLCDNSGKSVELGKTIAMSEFSPFVISTLNHYESKLYSERNDTAVAEFENAFALHKATQSYIMEHTIKALETKRDSIIIKLFSRDDYDELISDILAQKSAIDNLKCHTDMQESTVVNKTKVIAIKCPVDVYVYDENGKEIVRIVKDITEYVAEGINLFIEDGKKYIALPANQNYSLKIVATDKGEMEYRVTEYGDGVERLRTVTISKIPLITGRVFTGEIAESMEVSSDDYALMYVDSSDTPSQKPTTTPTTTKSPSTKSPKIATKTNIKSTVIKKAKVKNLKVKAKGKKITVSWKKIKIAKGYQVQVATNKKFKKKKIVFDKFTKKRKLIIKSSKIKRKKTYYVRVRAYAKINGKKVNGKWSKKIRVKIK